MFQILGMYISIQLYTTISDNTVKKSTNYGERILHVRDSASYSTFLSRQFRASKTVLKLARNLTRMV
jgi:hypothetical protein